MKENSIIDIYGNEVHEYDAHGYEVFAGDVLVEIRGGGSDHLGRFINFQLWEMPKVHKGFPQLETLGIQYMSFFNASKHPFWHAHVDNSYKITAPKVIEAFKDSTLHSNFPVYTYRDGNIFYFTKEELENRVLEILENV